MSCPVPSGDLRPAITAYARTLAGLSAAPSCPSARATYRDLIAPGETGQRADEMERMSGCALVARAVLRRFIVHPLLSRPYRTGDAMSDLVAIGRDAGALRASGSLPQAGDLVIVGGGTDGGGTEHAWTCLGTEWSGYEPRVLVSGLDGGQRDGGGYECIAVRDHEIREGVDWENGRGRLVRWVLDVERVVARFGRPA
jgi:hypothetical protein